MKKLLSTSVDDKGGPRNSGSWMNTDNLKSINISDGGGGGRAGVGVVAPLSFLDVEDSGRSSVDASKAPQPPESPMPSIAKYLKSTKFVAYKSTRPDLLNDLNLAISEGLKRLKFEGLVDDRTARLSMFKDVFQMFIENFTIYRPFLTTIKHEYETAIDSLVQELDSYATIDSQTEMREQAHLAKTLHIQHSYDRKVAELEEKVRSMEQSLKKVEKDKRSAQQEVRKIYDANVQLQKDCDEMRSTCVTLTGSLSRLEEERKKASYEESGIQAELASYKLSEQKAYAEIERLQGTIQTLEQMQSSMVAAETLASLEAVTENLRGDMRRLESTHRNVLVRYASLKSVAESAFKKHAKNRRPELQLNVDEHGFVSGEVDNILSGGAGDGLSSKMGATKASISRTSIGPGKSAISSDKDKNMSPTDKLLRLISENGAAPRLIIESLLDHVEKGGSFFGVHGGGPSSSGGGSSSAGGVTEDSHTSDAEFRSPWAHFVGMGYDDPQVPSYLQYSGRVQNTNLSKSDTLRIIHDIWAAKARYESTFGISGMATPDGGVGSSGSSDVSITPRVGAVVALDPLPVSMDGKRPGSKQHRSRPATGNKPMTAGSTGGGGGGGDIGGGLTTGTSASSSSSSARGGVTTTTPLNISTGVFSDEAALISPTVSVNMSPTIPGEDVVSARPIVSAPPESQPQSSRFEIFFEYYLESKFPNSAMVAEMAYNLVNALKKYSSVSDCRLFTCILEHKLPIDAWSDMEEMLAKVKMEAMKENDRLITSQELATAHAVAASLHVGGVGPQQQKQTSAQLDGLVGSVWKLTVDAVMRVVKKVLTSKGEHALSVLNKALALDNKGGRVVNLAKLFRDDSYIHRSLFCEQLRLQYINECLSVERHIMDSIDQFKDSADSVTMTVGKLRDALQYSDSNKSRIDINQLLSRGCGVAVEAMLLMEAKRSPVTIEDFKKRLRSGLLKKSAPKKNGA